MLVSLFERQLKIPGGLDQELPFEPRSCVNGLEGKAMLRRDNHILVVSCALLSSSLFS
jgi:hypothetical protein